MENFKEVKARMKAAEDVKSEELNYACMLLEEQLGYEIDEAAEQVMVRAGWLPREDSSDPFGVHVWALCTMKGNPDHIFYAIDVAVCHGDTTVEAMDRAAYMVQGFYRAHLLEDAGSEEGDQE